MDKHESKPNILSKVYSIIAISGLIFALNISGALWGFWRTYDGLTSAWVPNPATYDFWYGTGPFNLWYGYWYGYWFGDIDAWYYYDRWDIDENDNNYELTDLGDLPSVSTITWTPSAATMVKIQSSVQFSSTWWIKVVLPPDTEITEDNWWVFNPSTIATSWLWIWSVSLPTNENPVAAISFWVTWVKLEFSRPVKLEIPVPWVTTSTIKVKVKHFWDTSYNVIGLTNLSGATCLNWSATPWSDVATVVSWIATIYTCSASDFSTYTTTTSWGGWSTWGGWGWPSKDVCPISDLSWDLYDKTCLAKSSSSTWVTTTSSSWTWTSDSGTSGSWLTYAQPEPILLKTEKFNNNLNECFAWEKLPFPDISDSWAKCYIMLLYKLWIIDWKEGNYLPEANTTRAEFIKMVIWALNIDYTKADTSTLKFNDVDKASWQAKVIKAAITRWLVDPNNKKFRPDEAISRIEALKILLISLNYTFTDKYISTFTDVKDPWMVKYVETWKELWIIEWQTVDWKLVFRPTYPISRAESSKITVITFNLK